MCGIAGIIKREARVEQRELAAVAPLLRHRGPDDEGQYIKENLGLLHTRLSIIDLGGGHQPLFDPRHDTALIANGEIYNYLELRAPLQAAGCHFSTASDCETLLHSYACHGRDFLSPINGMFAFALHDGRRRSLYLGRDRLGIKPLYYAELPDRVIFASELKALLPLLPHAPAIHAPALLQFLQSQFNSGRDTIVAGIKRVLPGELIEIDAKLQLHHHRYWSPTTLMPRQIGFDEAREEFDQLFRQVMVEHMRSDVPFGLFLSGGVDSSVLLAMLTQLRDEPPRTYSVGFSESRGGDELDQASELARQFNTRHSALRLSGAELFARLPHTVWAADDLMRDYASLPTAHLAQAAGAELKVIFSGEGGDEVFAGYGRYRPKAAERWLKQLVRPGSGGFRTTGQWHARWSRRLFGVELKQVQSAMRVPFIAAWQQTPAHWSDLMRRQYVDLTTALPDNLLVKADRMLMAFGVEGRVPFLDHRIVEFGLTLPDSLKVDASGGKRFLKRWAESHLPSELLQRNKRGFHVPVGEWLQGPLLAQLADRLPHNAAVREWFDPQGVSALIKARQRGAPVSRELFSLLQFALWHRLFIDAPGSLPAPTEATLEWLE